LRVELIGGMGCGKTTLAKQLEKRGAVGVYEELGCNPFLKSCYDDFDTFKFPSQMWFALTKYHDIGAYNDPDKIYVHDQGILNNNAYTNYMFRDDWDEGARNLVQETFNYTEEEFGPAEVLIHIHCTPENQIERIRNRGRDYETKVDVDFVRGVDEQLENLMAEVDEIMYNRIIHIDSNTIDFNKDEIFIDEIWGYLNEEKEKIDNNHKKIREIYNN